jgi:hypothetical protein
VAIQLSLAALFDESILRIHVRQEAVEKVDRLRLDGLDREGSAKGGEHPEGCWSMVFKQKSSILILRKEEYK